MRKLNLIIGAILTVGILAATAGAVPLPSTISPPFPPVAGESDLHSFISPYADNINIDWLVIRVGFGSPFISLGALPGDFAYLYQIEAATNSRSGPDIFTITIPDGTAGRVLFGGVLANDDLDLATAFHQAHISGTFPGLTGEEESYTFTNLSSVSFSIAATNVTWSFRPLAKGKESNTLFFISPVPPDYGNATAHDSVPPSPWGSLAPGGDKVPIPSSADFSTVPEPSTVLLLLLGLFSFGFLAKRQKLRSDR